MDDVEIIDLGDISFTYIHTTYIYPYIYIGENWIGDKGAIELSKALKYVFNLRALVLSIIIFCLTT